MAFDSATTIFVAKDEKAAKRSIWIRRRANVLTEGVDTGEIDPIKVDESLNAADMHTKYLVFNVWRRHLWHAHNLTTERCAKARARMQAALAEFKQEFLTKSGICELRYNLLETVTMQVIAILATSFHGGGCEM